MKKKPAPLSRRILVVDDEPEVRAMLRDLLSLSGYTVLEADNAQEATAILGAGAIDLIMIDVIMPKVDGIALTKSLRDSGTDIPVIIMTGFASIDTAVESMKAGATDFITKPFNVNHVLFTIQKAFETQRLHRMAKESEHFKKLSYLDDLTGIHNHRYFDTFLNREIERQKRYRRPLALMMIDLDDFKRVNDTYGHQFGDETLREMAHLLRQAIRNSDFVARYGGEEFVVVLPETEPSEALTVGRRILESVNHHQTLPGASKGAAPVTLTIGLAGCPRHAKDREELIHRADEALYRGKREGKNCLCVYGARTKIVRP